MHRHISLTSLLGLLTILLPIANAAAISARGKFFGFTFSSTNAQSSHPLTYQTDCTNQCGTACCDLPSDGGPVLAPPYCADASKNLCCLQAQEPCDDVCCDWGEVCNSIPISRGRFGSELTFVRVCGQPVKTAEECKAESGLQPCQVNEDCAAEFASCNRGCCYTNPGKA
jgi:hypothetical protein